MTVESLVLTRHFKAPPERVFAAFTQKPLMQGWYGPQSMRAPQCDVDARVGGKYRIELHGAAGNISVVTGEFKEIDAPRRLVFSWGWLNGAGRNPETLVTLTFEPSGDGTELTLVQSGFLKEEFREGHREGWTSSFNGLEALLAGNPKATDAGPELLGIARSSYTQAARIAFFEKGVAHAFKSAPPHSPEILALNPFGKIPVLRLGKDSISEASAILRYIDEVYPGPALMPAEPLARAKAEQWISSFNAYFDRPIVRNYVLQYVFPRGAEGKPDREAIDAAVPEIRKALAALDAAYGERDYLVGEAPSLPDFLVAPPIHYLALFPEGRDLLANHANVKRAHDVFAGRPSFVAATSQGG
jgi:glutathione S-transferase